MKAYVILDVRVTDPDAYAEYKRHSDAALVPYDGRFLVRGGAAEVLEGDWQPNRIVVLEFPDIERARAWYDSPIYEGPKKIRQSASIGKMLLVEGV